jgi:hypothetical protein
MPSKIQSLKQQKTEEEKLDVLSGASEAHLRRIKPSEYLWANEFVSLSLRISN